MPKHRETTLFLSEYAKLTPQQKRRFRIAVKKIIDSLKAGKFPQPPLVNKMSGYAFYEVRWAADGRATFEYAYDATLCENIVIWRRVGDHGILNQP